jgi:hypothetical protein
VQDVDELGMMAERAVTRVASMSITTQPSKTLPAMTSQGNPVAVAAISAQACALAFARARAIRSLIRGLPARSRARRTVGPLGAVPSSGARWASSATSLMLVAPSAIAAAIETSTVPRSSSGDVLFSFSARLRPSGATAVHPALAPGPGPQAHAPP